MKLLLNTILLTLILLLPACITLTNNSAPRIDEVPMYGGMDRSSVPELKSGDEKFINSVSKEFGSRELAAKIFVDKGFEFYKKDKLAMAMRRFNQAWLLDPNYTDVYWGFASILSDQGKYCEAAEYMDTAFSKGQLHDSVLPDAAILYAACVSTNSNLNPSKKEVYLAKIVPLFKKAEAASEVDKEYVYLKWLKAMYALQEWESAWDKAMKYEKASGQSIPDSDKEELRKRLKEK